MNDSQHIVIGWGSFTGWHFDFGILSMEMFII